MLMKDQLELQLNRLSQIDIYSYDEVIYIVTKLLSKVENINELYKLIGALSTKGDDYNEFKQRRSK